MRTIILPLLFVLLVALLLAGAFLSERGHRELGNSLVAIAVAGLTAFFEMEDGDHD